MLDLVMALRLVRILGRRLSTAWHEVEKLEEDQRQFYSCEEFTLPQNTSPDCAKPNCTTTQLKPFLDIQVSGEFIGDRKPA